MRALLLTIMTGALLCLSCGGQGGNDDNQSGCTPASGEHGEILNAPTDAVVIQKESQAPPGELD